MGPEQEQAQEGRGHAGLPQEQCSAATSMTPVQMLTCCWVEGCCLGTDCTMHARSGLVHQLLSGIKGTTSIMRIGHACLQATAGAALGMLLSGMRYRQCL